MGKNESVKKKKEISDLSIVVSSLPKSPGVYLFSNENGKIIYIGKAKNLKKRVASYFNKTHDHPKTKLLVKKIREINYLIVESEEDALLLENNLIKKNQPQYNILLKDDKTYPWIVVRDENFPRIQLTRKKLEDKSHYYGPYTSVSQAKYLLKIIHSLYSLRTCNFILNKNEIKKNHLCLQYHIKQCFGPCIGLQTEEEYNKKIHLSEEILKGKYLETSNLLYKQMIFLSKKMRFEEAETVKKWYAKLKNYASKSIVASKNIHNVDVFSFDEDDQSAYINYLHITYGSIVHGYTIIYQKRLNESKETILSMGIVELRLRFNSQAKEIIVPFHPKIKISYLTITIPKQGEKKKLLLLSEKNVKQYKIDQHNKAEKLNGQISPLQILKTLQNELHLEKIPLYIECFDNSNTQGSYPVSSCIVFKRAKPSKKDYRYFNIQTVKGIDDFQSIYETLFRRYQKLKKEQQPFPDLIIIDGGKGQLRAATDALKNLDMYKKIPIIGIAKRLEEIYFPNDSVPLYLNKNSEGLKLIQQLRNESHRFCIHFHRQKRSKFQTTSELDSILGIGNVIKKKLLLKYKSIKQIKKAPKKEIISLIGEKKAQKLFYHFCIY